MSLPGVTIIRREPGPAVQLGRADVALFVGLVARDPAPVESWDEFTALYRWDGREVEQGSPDKIPSNLGLAVRSFFAEGGRKANVVRTGDPLALVDISVDEADFVAAKRGLLDGLGKARLGQAGLERLPLLPGFAQPGNDPDPSYRETWMGAAAIIG